MNTLVIDIGGTNIKLWRTGESERIKFDSGPEMTPDQLIAGTKEHLQGWHYDRVSIGFPGDVQNGHPSAEPYNLGSGWVGFDYDKHFNSPVKIMNDACMQALGSYEGGKMLYIGLGTGMGTVFISDGKIIPLALGHLKFYKGETFDHYLSRKGLERYGSKAFRRAVQEAAESLKSAFMADYVMIGGGNAKKLEELPEGCRRGSNQMAYTGGVRMWEAEVSAAGFSLYPQSAQAV
jgi:polyphosphate glucokinase